MTTKTTFHPGLGTTWVCLLGAVTSLLFTGCKTFDPTPFQNSAEMVRRVSRDTVDYETRWHQALIEACEANHTQAMAVLKAKLTGDVFDNLIKAQEPIGPGDQDVFFPIEGNRHAARLAWIGSLKTIITNHSVLVDTAGDRQSFDLIAIYKEERSTSQLFANLAEPQRELYRAGLSKLRSQIVAVPLVEQQEKDFETLRSAIEAHQEFVAQLGRQHGELEQELVSGLQSAASALEANLWLVQLGNKALSGLNGLLGKAPQLPAAETTPTETKP